MTTALTVITDALTIHLNRLSPGETLDADTAGTCLSALNSLADSLNGGKGLLFREILTPSGSGINAASAALGVAWALLASGDEILGASFNNGSRDIPLDRLTMEQYEQAPDKTSTGTPRYFVHDGAATVYFVPIPTGQTVTLRTKQVVSDFADLSTDYVMPKGYRSGLAAMLAEMLAPVMLGGVTPAIQRAASAARLRMTAQNMEPAILDTAAPYVWDINTGWR